VQVILQAVGEDVAEGAVDALKEVALLSVDVATDLAEVIVLTSHHATELEVERRHRHALDAAALLNDGV
jgi:hypothetical protein